MSGIVYKNNKSSEDKFADNIKKTLQKSPQRFIQPTIFTDKLTRKDYVNPEYVKLYGNPYNTKDPYNIYIEKGKYEEEDKILGYKKYWDSHKKDVKNINTNIQSQKVYDPGKDTVICVTCKAYNNNKCYECFYCGQSLILSKLINSNKL